MFENQINVYMFLLGYLQQTVADVSEEELDQQPVGSGNPPRWILGHLAVCCDYALKQMGGSPICPREWHVSFGPGSTPGAEGSAKPSKEELLATLTKGHEKVVEQLRTVSPETMSAPHGIVFLAGTPLQCKGDLVAHLMTSHEAGHVGQLTYWRRATGRKAFF
ncbi:DinB family protein [bacterium]|nr:DinB family protein [bacterium]